MVNGMSMGIFIFFFTFMTECELSVLPIISLRSTKILTGRIGIFYTHALISTCGFLVFFYLIFIIVPGNGSISSPRVFLFMYTHLDFVRTLNSSTIMSSYTQLLFASSSFSRKHVWLTASEKNKWILKSVKDGKTLDEVKWFRRDEWGRRKRAISFYKTSVCFEIWEGGMKREELCRSFRSLKSTS